MNARVHVVLLADRWTLLKRGAPIIGLAFPIGLIERCNVLHSGSAIASFCVEKGACRWKTNILNGP